MIYKNVLKSSLAWGLQLWLFVLLFKLTNHIIVKKEHFIRNINFSCIRSSLLLMSILGRLEVSIWDMRGPWTSKHSTLLENNEMYPLSAMTTYTLASKHPQLPPFLADCREGAWSLFVPRLPAAWSQPGRRGAPQRQQLAGRSSCIMLHFVGLNFLYSTLILWYIFILSSL